MGKYVHVVSQKEKYSEVEAFNRKQEEFKDLLNALNCYVLEEDPNGYCDRWLCRKDEYKQAIETLKAYSKDEEISEECDRDDISSALHELGEVYPLDPTPVVKMMEKLLSECDKDFKWLIFVAW